MLDGGAGNNMIGVLSAGAGGVRRGRANNGDRPDILPSDDTNGGE